jgi:hypothetical protein
MRDDSENAKTLTLLVGLAAVLILAFAITMRGVDTPVAVTESPPGTTGLARPHPPLDRAPAQPVMN